MRACSWQSTVTQRGSFLSPQVFLLGSMSWMSCLDAQKCLSHDFARIVGRHDHSHHAPTSHRHLPSPLCSPLDVLSCWLSSKQLVTMDVERLHVVLQQSFSPDANLRVPAEETVRNLKHLKGATVLLLQVAAETQVSAHVPNSCVAIGFGLDPSCFCVFQRNIKLLIGRKFANMALLSATIRYNSKSDRQLPFN